VIDAVAIREWCHARPGVTEERPFGPQTTVFKVEGKLFALCALEADPPLRLSLKCEPELAEALRRDHEAIAPGYHLNKRHWNTVTLDGSLPEPFVRDLVEDSYDLVLSKLTKRVRDALRLPSPPAWPNG